MNRRMLVLDLTVAQNIKDTPREVKGWWFGARTVWQSPTVGNLFGDVIADMLAKVPYVTVYSRTDLRYYFGHKGDLLKRKYPDLQKAQIETLIEQVSPEDYGRDLAVDKVVSGRILRCYTSANRTIHWWHSLVEVEIEVRDTETGLVEWKHTYFQKKNLRSQKYVMEMITRQLVKDLRREYFLEYD
ncbi:MAG: hypothetical protein V2A74_14005 [bacterium]